MIVDRLGSLVNDNAMRIDDPDFEKKMKKVLPSEG
jgi:hypothetical protein